MCDADGKTRDGKRNYDTDSQLIKFPREIENVIMIRNTFFTQQYATLAYNDEKQKDRRSTTWRISKSIAIC